MLSYLESAFKRGFWLVILAWIFIIYKIKILIGASYSADSYAIYLLGKNIIENGNFYSPAIRDFYLDPSGPLLSRSYPPLFPLLIGITDFFLQQGIAAGIVINLLIYVFSLYLWFTLSKQISKYLFFIPLLLPIIFSFVPAEHPLWRDASAGRTTPITLLLLLAALYLLSKPSLLTDNKTSIGVGIFLGLLTLARFDATIFCFALPAIIYLLTPISIKKIMLMYGALILVMLPWAIRNFIVFGSFLASDNALTAASNMVGIVQLQFFENGVPMGIDNPKLWLYQRTTYLKANINYFYSTLTYVDTVGTAGLLKSFFIKFIVFLYIPGFIFSFIFRKKYFSMWMYFIASLTWCVFNLLCISLTSYGHDARYHAISWFLLIGGSAYFIAAIVQKLFVPKNEFFTQTEKVSAATVGMELFLFLALFALTIHTYSKTIYTNQQDNYWSWWKQTDSTPVKKGEWVAAIQAEKVAYYTGWNTIYLPSNQPGFVESSTYGENPQAWKNYRAWLKHWKPTYLVVRLFEYDNPLTQYPHATALTILDSGLDPVVLLKINLDEAALTEQDKINNDKMRALWGQTIHSKMPEHKIFYAGSPAFKNGIAIEWDGFIVPNTPENQSKFALQRVVLLPNGEQRVINEAWFEGHTRYIRVYGGPISTEFSELPDSFKTIDGDPIPAFFITNETWLRGVARKWAGFFVQNNAQNQQHYKVGHTVQLPTGDERTITKVTSDTNIITVYLTGDPIDGFKVGTPEHFKVVSK
jgi:hypothetical protein